MVGQRVYQPRHDPWHFHTFPPQPIHLRQIKLISFPNILIWFDLIWYYSTMIHLTATLPNNLFTLPSYNITLWGIELAERFLCKCLCWVDYINEEQLSDKFGRPQTANLQFLLLTRPFWSESHISCLLEDSPTEERALERGKLVSGCSTLLGRRIKVIFFPLR